MLKISKSLTLQNSIIAESLFRVFDQDKNGTLSFDEYLQASKVKNLDTPEEKLNWIFTAFDEDGGGSIDVDEIRDIVEGLFRLGGIEQDEDMIAACVQDVRELFDILQVPAYIYASFHEFDCCHA